MQQDIDIWQYVVLYQLHTQLAYSCEVRVL